MGEVKSVIMAIDNELISNVRKYLINHLQTGSDSQHASVFANFSDFGELDTGFPETISELVEKSGMSHSEFYFRAGISRQLFHRISSNQGYRPAKSTVFACAIALELSLEETEKLLEKAGYALSRSFRSDVVIEYFIVNRIYDISKINEVLYEFDLQPLGSM